jgi:hypothetical protein
MTQDPPSECETRRAEPEILPPHQPRQDRETETSVFRLVIETGNGRRLYFSRPSPLAFTLAALTLGGVFLALLLLLLGTFVIALPAIGVLAAGTLLYGLARQFRRGHSLGRRRSDLLD